MARKILTQLDALKEIVSISSRQLTLSETGSADDSSLSQEEGDALISMASTLDLANWTNTEGNSMQITYYSGTENPNNPSNNEDNVQYITYLQGATTVLTKEYIYDASDRVISIVAVTTP